MKSEKTKQFAVCLNNRDYPASLEVGKLYLVIPDEEASAEGYLRVVDESGEDYAFAANRFYIVQLPADVEEAIIGERRERHRFIALINLHSKHWTRNRLFS